MGRIIDNVEKIISGRTDGGETQTARHSEQDETQPSLILLLWLLGILLGLLTVIIFVWFKVRTGKRRSYFQIANHNKSHSSFLNSGRFAQRLSATKCDQPTKLDRVGQKSLRTATTNYLLATFNRDMLKKLSTCNNSPKSNKEQAAVVRSINSLHDQKKLNVLRDCVYDSFGDRYTRLNQLNGRKLSEDSKPKLIRGASLSDVNQLPSRHVLGKKSFSFRTNGVSYSSSGATERRRCYRSLSNPSKKWIQYSQQKSERGGLSFSLSYICTVNFLQVTIHKLTGLRPFDSSDQCLIARKQAAFVVDVELRRTLQQLDSQKAVEQRPLRRTQPACGIFNPVFDQTLKFDLNVQDIRLHELIFTIYRTALQENVNKRRNQSITLYSTSKRQNPLNLSMLGNRSCMGVVHYQLNKDTLLNNSDELQGIWKELQPPSELDEMSADDDASNDGPILESLRQQTSSNSGTNMISNVIESGNSKGETPAIEISIVYEAKDSTLSVSLCGVKNLKPRSTDVCVFIRSVLYEGETILATSRSRPVAIPSQPVQRQSIVGKEKHMEANMGTPTLVLPPGEIARFHSTVSRILKNDALGLVIYVCSRSWLGKSQILGQCATGGASFSRNELTQHWQQFVDLLRGTQETEKGTTFSTEPIIYWHSLT